MQWPTQQWDLFVPRLKQVHRADPFLPVELIAMIQGDDALRKEDIVSIGVSSRTMWQYVLKHIQRDHQKLSAP